MDRRTCSFMSGPAGAPLGSGVKTRGKERRGEERTPILRPHPETDTGSIYLFFGLAYIFNLNIWNAEQRKNPDYLPHKSMPPQSLDRQNYSEIITVRLSDIMTMNIWLGMLQTQISGLQTLLVINSEYSNIQMLELKHLFRFGLFVSSQLWKSCIRETKVCAGGRVLYSQRVNNTRA